MSAGWKNVLKVVLAIVFPPLGVFLETGCSVDLLINIVLTLLGYIPGIRSTFRIYINWNIGIIHALYVIARH